MMVFEKTDLSNILLDMKDEAFNALNYKREENAHRLFLYPAMMVPLAQEIILNKIKNFIPQNARVIDPFMGAATSLVSSMKFGFHVYGQDINPLAILISKVKTGPFLCTKFRNDLEKIIDEIKNDNKEEIEVNFNNIDKWFKKDIQIELSKIRRAIKKQKNIFSRRFFWVVFAETIRLTSNDRTSTYKLHVRSIEDIESRKVSPIDEFIRIGKRRPNYSVDELPNLPPTPYKILTKTFNFGIQRIKRYKSPYSDDLLQKFMQYLSRNAFEHDFVI